MASIPLPAAVKSWFGFYIIVIITFAGSTLIINFVQLCSLIIWPFDKQLYRKINYYLTYLSWCQFTFVAQWWSGCNCILYGDPSMKKYLAKEHIVVTMNHTYEIDWLMAWILSERFGILGGTKIFGKDSLRYVPFIGWCWYFTESIFLKRNWVKDEKILNDRLRSLLDFPVDFPIVLLLFPEGTRLTPAKHEASLKVAREKGYPEFKYHLLPRTKGFAYSMKTLKGSNINAVYDICVGFEGNTVKPSLMNVLRGKQITGHTRIKRYEITDMPDTEEELGVWLRNLFKEKDDIMDNYHKTGKFDLPAIDVPQRPHDLLVWIFWASVICIPLFYYLINIVIAGSLLQQIIVVIAIALITVFSKWMVGFAEIEKGSAYGNETKINGHKKAD